MAFVLVFATRARECEVWSGMWGNDNCVDIQDCGDEVMWMRRRRGQDLQQGRKTRRMLDFSTHWSF